LSADSEDFKDSWPARYTFLEHQVYDDLAQQWFYNEKDGSIHNNATPSYSLQNDKGELQVGNIGSTDAKVDAKFPRKAGVWHWDGPSKQLQTEVGDYTDIIGTFNSPKPNEYIKVGIDSMMNINARTHWRVEYCNQVELGTRQPNPSIESSQTTGVVIDSTIANNVVNDGHAKVVIPKNDFGDDADAMLSNLGNPS